MVSLGLFLGSGHVLGAKGADVVEEKAADSGRGLVEGWLQRDFGQAAPSSFLSQEGDRRWDSGFP